MSQPWTPFLDTRSAFAKASFPGIMWSLVASQGLHLWSEHAKALHGASISKQIGLMGEFMIFLCFIVVLLFFHLLNSLSQIHANLLEGWATKTFRDPNQ